MATAAPNHDRNKIAIIVGASRGLGLGLAREFARRGWQVTATARSTAAATELADEVTASDGGIAVEEVDLDRPESVDVLATRLAGQLRPRLYQRGRLRAPAPIRRCCHPAGGWRTHIHERHRADPPRASVAAAHCRRRDARLHVLGHGLGRRQSVGWHGALSGKQGRAQLADFAALL